MSFTKDELIQISNVFMTLKFSPGQTKSMISAENIIKKCNTELEQKSIKPEGE